MPGIHVPYRKSSVNEVQSFIEKNALFQKTDNILVAVSGGADSVVLCHLLHQLGYKIGIAHCNFQMREEESDDDEHFVMCLAAKLKVPFYVKRFDTEWYAANNDISVQMAARNLRYAWFEEIRAANNYTVVAVAHHRDDEVETFFINLIRGTGIAGLHGIRPVIGKIVRPMLCTTRLDIEEYASHHRIKYRTDSSNLELKYLRNHIRQKLIPLLREMNPQFDIALKHGMQNLKQLEEVMLVNVQEKREELMQSAGDMMTIDTGKLLLLSNPSFFLFEFLRPYGFSGNIINKILKSMHCDECKQFFSISHRLVKDRDKLLLTPLPVNETVKIFTVAKTCKRLKEPLQLKLSLLNVPENFEVPKEKTTGVFDCKKLVFPLSIRKWREGDYFYPYGMKGRKKVSDFLNDLKLSLPEKENTWLLCNGNEIIWVIGHRTDDRYKVTGKTKKVYVAELICK
jgi:tRNA(Ile)-lysidine synthase